MTDFLVSFGVVYGLTAGCIKWVVWYLCRANTSGNQTDIAARCLRAGLIAGLSIFITVIFVNIYITHVMEPQKGEFQVDNQLEPDQFVAPPSKLIVDTQTILQEPISDDRPPIEPGEEEEPEPVRIVKEHIPEEQGSTPPQAQVSDTPKQEKAVSKPVNTVPEHAGPPPPRVYQDIVGEDLNGRSEVRKVTLSPHYWYILKSSYLSSPIWFDGTEPRNAQVNVRVNDGAPITVTANTIVTLKSRIRKIAFQSGESEDISIYITKKRSVIRAKVNSKSVLADAIESVGETVIANGTPLSWIAPESNTSQTRTTQRYRYTPSNTRQSSSTRSPQPTFKASSNKTTPNVRRPSNQETNTAPVRPTRSSTLNRGEPRANRNRSTER